MSTPTVKSDTADTTPDAAAKRTRNSSSFEVVPETPPPPQRAASSGMLFKALQKIEETPNEWFRIATCNSRSGANSMWSTLKKGTRKTPKPLVEYEFTARIDAENDQSVLYARFVGPEKNGSTDS